MMTDTLMTWHRRNAEWSWRKSELSRQDQSPQGQESRTRPSAWNVRHTSSHLPTWCHFLFADPTEPILWPTPMYICWPTGPTASLPKHRSVTSYCHLPLSTFVLHEVGEKKKNWRKVYFFLRFADPVFCCITFKHRFPESIPCRTILLQHLSDKEF